MNELIVASLLVLLGLGLLVLGGELLVRGATNIAARFGIPPLVIGLTVVAFGTSAPELGVSLQASFSGAVDVAVGNVVGSNVFNILLILGLSAVVTPLLVSSQLIRFDLPLVLCVSILTWALAFDGQLGRIDGYLLFAILIVYLGICLKLARRDPKLVQDEFAESYGAESLGVESVGGEATQASSVWLSVAWVVSGLVCLGLGSRWLVGGAVSIATWMGVSELVIGLTVVAAGTSLPEVVTSVVASLRGQRDIAVGNVVGSNLFNLACVLGLSAMIAPAGIPVAAAALSHDMPIMILATALCLPVFLTGHVISRLEGILFLACFVAYTVFLIYK